MIETVIDMRPQTANELTTIERAELGRYEAVIKRGLDSFVEVGNALVAIRDGKLYRAEFATFDEYCRGRWNISRSYAHRTIDAAQVVENLLPIGNILPANEAQARPLAKLTRDERQAAWQMAVDEANDRRPTAAQVERAVERVRPPRPKPTPPASKVVYTEPVAKAQADAADDEAEAIALVAAETAQEDAERAPRDAERPSFERVAEPTMPEDLVRAGYSLWHTRNGDTGKWGWKWQLDLPGSDGGSGADADRHFGPFVATPDQAIADAREHQRRVGQAQPDSRIAEARSGIEAINAARVWVRDHYHDLTGKATDELGFWRDTAAMVMRLESLVSTLEKAK